MVSDERRRNARAMIAALITFAALSSMDAIVKWLSGEYPLLQLIFFVTLFACIPVALYAAFNGGTKALRPRRPGLVAARAVLLAVENMLILYAVTQVPLTDAYALIFTTPLLAAALGVLLLGDRVGWRSWLALAIGFAGVLVVLRPGFAEIALGHWSALGAALLFAVSVVVLRRAGEGESVAALVFSLLAASLVLCAPGLFDGYRSPDLAHWGLMILAGLLFGSAQMALVWAFRSVPTAIVAPMQYTLMLWGIGFGLLLFDDHPDLAVLLGSLLIIGGALLAAAGARREARAG